MTRLTYFFCCFLLGTFCLAQPSGVGRHAAAGKCDASIDPAMQQIKAGSIRAHIRYLADDLLEGRATARRGHQLAAIYVASQFEALGLEPAGQNGSYFQPVPLREIRIVPEKSAVTITQNATETQLALGKDFATQGSEVKEDSRVEGGVAYVGFGVTAPERNYDDYAGVDVHGKIVAVFRGAPSAFAGNERAYYASASVKAANAAAHGAIAVLSIYLPEEQYFYYWPLPAAMRWTDPKGWPNDAAPGIGAFVLLSKNGAEQLFKNSSHPLEDVYSDLRAGHPHGFELPAMMTIHLVSRHTETASPNVVALLRGSDPALRNEYIVFSAHLDHLGMSEPGNNDTIYHGARDNASGVASILEIARAFTGLAKKPRRSIIFLASTGEEKGLIGSDYFAHFPPVEGKITANINIDIAPSLYPLRDVVGIGAEHSSMDQLFHQAAGCMQLQVTPDPWPDQLFLTRSDQYSFVKQGIPSLSIKQGLQSGDPAVDGAAIYNDWQKTRYHSTKDTFNQPWNFDATVKSAQLNLLIGYLLATQQASPAWNKGDFFGDRFGPVKPVAAKASLK